MALTFSMQKTRLDFRHRAARWALLTLLFTSPATVFAQSASEKAAAEALFDQGVQLLKKGDYSAACKKLEKSQAVEPGIGTLLYLGECYSKLGKTASAWATFREAASKAHAAGEEDRARAGNARADALEPKLSYVSFEVADETAQLEGLQVVQGKSEVSSALFGTQVPVDPGELKVVASAPGHESFEISIQIQKGPSETTISIPALPLLPESERDQAAASTTQITSTNSSDGLADEPPRAGSTQRTLGIVIGAVGLAGVGAGTAFGIMAINKDSQADEVCNETTCDPGSDGYSFSSTARTYATVSTVAIAAGAALAVGGIVLYFTAPKANQAALMLEPTVGGARFSLGGTF